MPLYTYKCDECQQRFECLTLPSIAKSDIVCPTCHSSTVKKVFTPAVVGVSYKTDGFFNTDNGRSSMASTMMSKIKTGSLTDFDIQEITSGEDTLLKNTLDKKANEGFKKKKELDNEFGKGAFDGVDNDGMLYKDLDVSEILNPR